MQLHSYQQIVLDDLENYLRHCRTEGNYRKAYGTYWDQKPTLENGYICPPENRGKVDRKGLGWNRGTQAVGVDNSPDH